MADAQVPCVFIAHRCLELFLGHTFAVLVLTGDWRLLHGYSSVIRYLKGEQGLAGVPLCDFSSHRWLGVLLAQPLWFIRVCTDDHQSPLRVLISLLAIGFLGYPL